MWNVSQFKQKILPETKSAPRHKNKGDTRFNTLWCFRLLLISVYKKPPVASKLLKRNAACCFGSINLSSRILQASSAFNLLPLAPCAAWPVLKYFWKCHYINCSNTELKMYREFLSATTMGCPTLFYQETKKFKLNKLLNICRVQQLIVSNNELIKEAVDFPSPHRVIKCTRWTVHVLPGS